MVGVSLLFGEVLVTISDEKFHVPGVGLVYPRVVDFVNDSMRYSEPDPTLITSRGPYPHLGAGSPAGSNTRPTRSNNVFIGSHMILSSWIGLRANLRFIPGR